MDTKAKITTLVEQVQRGLARDKILAELKKIVAELDIQPAKKKDKKK